MHRGRKDVESLDGTEASDTCYYSQYSVEGTRYHAARELRFPYEKQGHVCCMCCCDVRRAAVMVNFANGIFCCLGLAVVGSVDSDLVPLDEWWGMAKQAMELDDDTNPNDLLGTYALAICTFFGIGILFSWLGVLGAIRFRRDLVVICALWYLIQGIVTLVLWGWAGVGIIWAGFLAYPNLILFQEITEGIMTYDNYPNEVHSCCCVSAPKKQPTIREAIENRVGVFS
eukprot:Nitzschia sp. Nitz4//scaffold32_size149145//42274//43044//NITZ4_002871-RA/size149145-augustus-gene-0.26-mRNA-1//1//CDS//3329548045//2207//frame0